MADVENGRFKVGAGTLVQWAVLIVSVALAYAALDARIQVLEVKYDRIQQDLWEIKADVKALLQRRP